MTWLYLHTVDANVCQAVNVDVSFVTKTYQLYCLMDFDLSVFGFLMSIFVSNVSAIISLSPRFYASRTI